MREKSRQREMGFEQRFLVAQTVKKSACNAGDLDSIPGLGRSAGEGNRNLECQVHESRQIGSGQTRDGKSECRHSRKPAN